MYVETPLIKSPFFPIPTLLKLENTQPSGSFKSRGMTAVVEAAVAANPEAHFFASSGGNAGLAVAEAAATAGRPCTVVIPSTSPERTLLRLRKLGAQAIAHGSVWAEADAYLRSEVLPEYSNAVFCHPFMGTKLWEGHSTLVDELVDQLHGEKPGGIVLSVGGGGLFLGVMEGLLRYGWTDVPVFAVETEGAACFHEALKVGHPVPTYPASIAKSLGASEVSNEAVEMAKRYGNTFSVVVTDEEALSACRQFADDHCTIVEPACGATLAAIYGNKLSYIEGPVVAVVCGGSAYTAADLLKST